MSVSLLSTADIRYGRRDKTKTIEMTFQLTGTLTPAETEKCATRLIENIMASINGISKISSVTRSSGGSINLTLKNNAMVESVMADIERELEVKREMLPKGLHFGQPKYTENKSSRISLILGPVFMQDDKLREELQNYLLQLPQINGLNWSGLPEKIGSAQIQKRFRPVIEKIKLAKNSDLTPIRMGNFKALPSEKTHVKTWIGPAGYDTGQIVEGIRSGQPIMFHWNTLPAIKLDIKYYGIGQNHNFLSGWDKFNNLSDQIKIRNDTIEFKAHQLPFFADLLVLNLMFFLSDVIRKHGIKYQKIMCYGVLCGISVCILNSIDEITDHTLLLNALCLAGCLPGIYFGSLRSVYSLILSGIAVIILIILFSNIACVLLLLIPLASFLCKLFVDQNDPSNHESDNQYPPIKVVTLAGVALLAITLILFIQISFENEEKQKSVFLLQGPGMNTMDVHLFFRNEQTYSEMTAFVHKLERDLGNIIKEKSDVYGLISQTGYAHIQIESKDIPQPVRKYLTRRALRTSGVLWFISHGNFEFSNNPRPVFPKHHWKLIGYDLDSLQSYADSVLALLTRTPRVIDVRLGDRSWLPTRIEKPVLYFQNYAVQGSAFKTIELPVLSNGKKVIARPDPPDQWELLNRIYESDKRQFRGFQLFITNKESRSLNIVKENRQFVLEIVHDYSGTAKMNREFIRSTVGNISSILPVGINLDTESLNILSQQHDSADLLKIILLFIICVSILHNNPIRILEHQARFALLYLVFQISFLISDITFPEEWLIIPMILMLQCLLMQWRLQQDKWHYQVILLALFFAYQFMREFPVIIPAGIFFLTGIYFLIPPDLRWFSKVSLPLLPWRGRQFSQRN
ncbi:hypothetical protein [Fulvivirga sedimenti]|uniref:Efflux RND transporter permease subunit n=1 Tax=Fulvivirga sedimenti TaxID=2879465 RepID=A0A9X1KZ04_9BACT|nr:hypothetical protein [Fulvivirga sedimenti]MCA6074161.1 hypothetical protein [Fulvivirga sedimenti]